MKQDEKYNSIARKIAYRLIDEGKAMNADYNAVQLAEDLGIDKRVLSNVLRKTMNTTFPTLVNRLRVEKAMKLLKTNAGMTMEEIGTQCGFNNRMSFYKNFNKMLGMTPKEYQEGKETNHVNIERNKDNFVSCCQLTLKTLSARFPEDTVWKQMKEEWQGYSAETETIYKIGNGIKEGGKSIFPVTIINSMTAETIEIKQ